MRRVGRTLVGLATLGVVAAVAMPVAVGDPTPADHDAIVATLHDFFDGGIGSDAARFCDASIRPTRRLSAFDPSDGRPRS